jgi:hypothetical protein
MRFVARKVLRRTAETSENIVFDVPVCHSYPFLEALHGGFCLTPAR